MKSAIYGTSANDGLFKPLGPFRFSSTGSNKPVYARTTPNHFGVVSQYGKITSMPRKPLHLPIQDNSEVPNDECPDEQGN